MFRLRSSVLWVAPHGEGSGGIGRVLTLFFPPPSLRTLWTHTYETEVGLTSNKSPGPILILLPRKKKGRSETCCPYCVRCMLSKKEKKEKIVCVGQIGDDARLLPYRLDTPTSISDLTTKDNKLGHMLDRDSAIFLWTGPNFPPSSFHGDFNSTQHCKV